MRQIHISITQAGEFGPEPVPDGSFQLWYPTARRILPTSYQLPTPVRVDLVNGQALSEKDHTTSAFCWAIQTFIWDQLGSSINYKTVPDGPYATILEFEDLTEVDPDTIAVPGEPSPMWVAQLTELTQAINARPDILILNQGAPIPNGTAVNTIILRRAV